MITLHYYSGNETNRSNSLLEDSYLPGICTCILASAFDRTDVINSGKILYMGGDIGLRKKAETRQLSWQGTPGKQLPVIVRPSRLISIFRKAGEMSLNSHLNVSEMSPNSWKISTNFGWVVRGWTAIVLVTEHTKEMKRRTRTWGTRACGFERERLKLQPGTQKIMAKFSNTQHRSFSSLQITA